MAFWESTETFQIKETGTGSLFAKQTLEIRQASGL